MLVSVPGRVNLIGEHIDYHDLPVLPMALPRRVSVAFEVRPDRALHAVSHGYPARQVPFGSLEPFPPGDWGNYLQAAVQMLEHRWPLARGIDAAITSDLPLAAGLSSSSALLTGVALALLQANGIVSDIESLMELLPEGEQFVGTRGGGMDHAAVLASRTGCALHLHFAPFAFEHIRIPQDWTFLVAHSLTTAQKSGPAKLHYNARRTAGSEALRKLGFSSYRALFASPTAPPPTALSPDERAAFLHVTSETRRVTQAVQALRSRDMQEFGALLSASHASLRDQLQVSNAALDELVDRALEAGALGARLTGAGFGGCVLLFCRAADRDQIAARLAHSFYRSRPEFSPAQHLIFAEPSAGALSV